MSLVKILAFILAEIGKHTAVSGSLLQMYEQMNLESSEILHKTKLLLSVYRDVVWATLHEADEVHEDIYCFGSELTDALVYLEEFAPDWKLEMMAKLIFEHIWKERKEAIDTVCNLIKETKNPKVFRRISTETLTRPTTASIISNGYFCR